MKLFLLLPLVLGGLSLGSLPAYADFDDCSGTSMPGSWRCKNYDPGGAFSPTFYFVRKSGTGKWGVLKEKYDGTRSWNIKNVTQAEACEKWKSVVGTSHYNDSAVDSGHCS